LFVWFVVKNKKEMFVKQITFVVIWAVLSVVATSCSSSESKPQTQTLSETSAAINAGNYVSIESYASIEAYAKILNGDLSDFAGTWVNIHGESRQLYADGIFGSPGTISNFTKNDEGTSDAYKWYVLEGINEPIPGEYGYFVYLYPAGAALDIEGLNIINGYHIRGILANDSTKDRIILRPRPQHDSLQPDYFVFYREGEAPNAETLFAQALPELVQAQIKAALGEYKKILRNETGFNYENSVNVYLSSFQSGNRENNFGHFTVFDWDGTDIPKLVLHNMNNGDSLVLQYDNRRVYGIKLTNRAMRYLKKDATFNSEIGIIQIFRNELLCLVESGTREFDVYMTYQDSKEDVIWHELTIENINNLNALYYITVKQQYFIRSNTDFEGNEMKILKLDTNPYTAIEMIGWSNNGLFAYRTRHMHDSGLWGGRIYSLIIIDTVTDEIIERESFIVNTAINQDDAKHLNATLLPEDISSDLTKECIARWNTILRNYKISGEVGNPIASDFVNNLLEFPINDYICWFDDPEYTFEKYRFNSVNEVVEFKMDVYNWMLIIGNENNQKIISEGKDELYADMPNINGRKILGYYKSPYENRIVVVTIYYDWIAFSGGYHTVKLDLIGCNMNVGLN